MFQCIDRGSLDLVAGAPPPSALTGTVSPQMCSPSVLRCEPVTCAQNLETEALRHTDTDISKSSKQCAVRKPAAVTLWQTAKEQLIFWRIKVGEVYIIFARH